jgi:plastocyanin
VILLIGMFRTHKVLACAALAAALAACGGSGSDKSSTSSRKPAPDAKKVDPATAGNITGKVLWEGAAPSNPVIKMGSDPACGTGELRGETYAVDNGGLKNVFVYVKDGLGNKWIFDPPTEAATIDQKSCHYVPHVVGVRAGFPLEVINSDATLHNVHGMPKENREFNQGQALQGVSSNVTFENPEVLIPFKCDVHAWMSAYVGVVDHPYFAVSGAGGAFELRGLPPGTYTIEAVHEKLGRQTQSVTLADKESKELTFSFKMP